MPDTPPARIGSCEVERELGRGGGGVVYLARDTDLDRHVAIKALPTEFVADAERLQRFEREARVLASLQHPHVASIHGLEKVDDARYLILEFVDGESMDDVVARGPLAIPDALECARQIAEGLEAAHERGIVHRDLKPANLRRTPDGVVKVLDFGLAKEIPFGGAAPDDTSIDITVAGGIVGTPAYLAPEQACGRTIDRRVDIWAFGCVVFELLTARRVFAEATLPELLHAILEREPDLDALPPRVPDRVRDLLQRCLAKDPRQRLRDIGDARIELERALRERQWAGKVHSAPAKAHGGTVLGWLVPLSVGVTVALLLSWWWTRPVGAAPMHLTLDVGAGQEQDLTVGFISRLERSFRWSPDGDQIGIIGVVTSERGREPAYRLYLRDLDRYGSRIIPGSEGVEAFDFSPDGRWLCMIVPESADSMGYVLVKAPVDGSAEPERIAEWFEAGVLWLETGDIVSSLDKDSLMVASAETGEMRKVALRTEGFALPYRCRVIQALPGAGRVLVDLQLFAEAGYETAVGTVDLDTGDVRVLVEGAGTGVYLDASGQLLFARHDHLMAVDLDVDSLQVRGTPRALLSGMGTRSAYAPAWFDVSSQGALLFAPGGVQGRQRRLVFVDERGRMTPWSDEGFPFEERLESSFDGKRIAVTLAAENGLYEVWGSELADSQLRLLASDPGGDCLSGVLTPSGDALVYGRTASRDRSGIYRLPFGGSGEPELLYERPDAASGALPIEVSPDGRALLLRQTVDGLRSLWLLPLDPLGADAQFVGESESGSSGGFSPDSRWLAALSTQAGRTSVLVRSLDTAALALGDPLRVPLPRGWRPVAVSWSKQLQDGNPVLCVLHDFGYRWERMTLRVGDSGPEFSAPELHFDIRGVDWIDSEFLADGRLLCTVPGPKEKRVDRLRVVLGFEALLDGR